MIKKTISKLFFSSESYVTADSWDTDKIRKAILFLGIPLIIGEIGSIAQQFADTIMVGHYGTIELAAAGFVNSIFYFVIFLTLGMSFATTSLIASENSKNNKKSVNRILYESLITNLLVGLFFVGIMFLIYSNMETLFFNKRLSYQQPREIFEMSREYMMMLIISVPFLTLFYACKQFLDGVGNTNVSMWILLASNVLNVGLNYCFIFGKFGCPEMGLKGAGFATLVSRIFQLIVVGYVVLRRYVFNKKLNNSEEILVGPTIRGVLEQIKIGLPISIQLGLEIGVFNVCGLFMGFLGAEPLAAHQAMYTISTICFQVLYGIGAAGTILIGHFYGMGALQNIRKTVREAFQIGFIFDFITILIIGVFIEQLSSCFTSDSSVVLNMCLIYPCMLLYQVGDCLQIIYANALRGIKDTKPLWRYASFSYICVCVPICYIVTFELNMGVAFVWAGIPVGLLLAGILFYRRFKYDMKQLVKNNDNCLSVEK